MGEKLEKFRRKLFLYARQSGELSQPCESAGEAGGVTAIRQGFVARASHAIILASAPRDLISEIASPVALVKPADIS